MYLFRGGWYFFAYDELWFSQRKVAPPAAKLFVQLIDGNFSSSFSFSGGGESCQQESGWRPIKEGEGRDLWSKHGSSRKSLRPQRKSMLDPVRTGWVRFCPGPMYTWPGSTWSVHDLHFSSEDIFSFVANHLESHTLGWEEVKLSCKRCRKKKKEESTRSCLLPKQLAAAQWQFFSFHKLLAKKHRQWGLFSKSDAIKYIFEMTVCTLYIFCSVAFCTAAFVLSIVVPPQIVSVFTTDITLLQLPCQPQTCPSFYACKAFMKTKHSSN